MKDNKTQMFIFTIFQWLNSHLLSSISKYIYIVGLLYIQPFFSGLDLLLGEPPKNGLT